MIDFLAALSTALGAVVLTLSVVSLRRARHERELQKQYARKLLVEIQAKPDARELILDDDGPADSFPKKYTVVSGDTLWAIAERFYGDGARYQKQVDETKSPGHSLHIPQ